MSAHASAGRTVGLVGLGVMGGTFARWLIERGYGVVGFDVDAERAAAVERLGGRIAASPAAVREGSDVVLTSLPSDAALDAVVSGQDGLAAASGGADLVAETSTLAVARKREARAALAAHGVTLLDCPVSGSGDQAAVGDLIVLASGERDRVEAIADILDALGRGHHYLGEFGAGTLVKLVANQLVIVNTTAAAEALRIVNAAGVDSAAAFAALCDGSGSSRMFELRGEGILARTYRSRTRLDVLVKDANLIDEANAELGLEAPLFALSGELLRRASELGHGDADPGIVAELLGYPDA